MPPKGGPARPVVVIDDGNRQGGPALSVYFCTEAEIAVRGVMGGPAMPIRIVYDEELIENGGSYWADGDPTAIPVYEYLPGEIAVEGR